MIATTRPLSALTASGLMRPGVVTVPQDTPLGAAAQLLLRRRAAEAAVVDAEGRYVGVLSAADLLRSVLRDGRRGAGGVPPPACPYRRQGRVPAGAEALLCTLAEGRCPLQRRRATAGGRRDVVCLLPDELLSDWQQAAGRTPAVTVRRCLTPAPAVPAAAPLSAVVRAVLRAHARRLVVVDGRNRPIGAVSCLDVLEVLTARAVRRRAAE